jgi:hypothetical protein
MIDKSIIFSLFGAGLFLGIFIHPYLAYVLWGLALVVLFQEVFLLAALPFIALWHWASRKP